MREVLLVDSSDWSCMSFCWTRCLPSEFSLIKVSRGRLCRSRRPAALEWISSRRHPFFTWNQGWPPRSRERSFKEWSQVRVRTGVICGAPAALLVSREEVRALEARRRQEQGGQQRRSREQRRSRLRWSMLTKLVPLTKLEGNRKS